MKKALLVCPIIQAMIHLAAILVGYGLAALLSTDDKLTYGAISGWWLSLYAGLVFNVRWSASVPFSILFVAVLLADIFLNAGWFYDEGASSNLIGYFLLSLIGLGGFIVPIFINELVRRFTARRKERGRSD